PVLTLLRLEPASAASGNFGLAVDLGSTNIVGALVDLDTGATAGEHSMLNPQVEHGEDILSRTHFSMRPSNLKQLQAQAASAISLIAAQLAIHAGICAGDISCISVSGNTTMTHFLLGLATDHLCRAPYVPVANYFPIVYASELNIEVHPSAPVIVLPNVGSYVGGDALAGILVSGMHGHENVSLLVDIGTNAEIVIGNRDFLLVGAGSAGPGLEGGAVRHGMRAAAGAIERVTIDPQSHALSYHVIGDGRPSGICGSGLIDLMAELFSTGIIDSRGKFLLPAKSSRVQLHDGVAEFMVAEAKDTATGADICFSQPDIDNLMLSKAAMYTMLSVMTDAVGMSFNELENFFLAGAFGAYITADKAVTIGIVPDIELSKFRLLGNSSLEGAKRVLLSVDALKEIKQIMSAITYVEMNESREFMTDFMAARFLPHTDLDRFPSVRDRLRQR
ncbi:MAG: ASKHA domain-containing protein, partial [Desulfobulbaceae bacterium]|nr:ASKHA domain-containing protein [Desulfobulbaceae bacterium]